MRGPFPDLAREEPEHWITLGLGSMQVQALAAHKSLRRSLKGVYCSAVTNATMSKLLIFAAVAVCAMASPVAQQQQRQQPQPQPQADQQQILAYLQQLQAQQSQLQQQQPQVFQAATQQQQPQVFQAAPQQYQPQQPQPQYQRQQYAAPQPQQPQQNLLGVAYSSAADASKASFNGYGISYTF